MSNADDDGSDSPTNGNRAEDRSPEAQPIETQETNTERIQIFNVQQDDSEETIQLKELATRELDKQRSDHERRVNAWSSSLARHQKQLEEAQQALRDQRRQNIQFQTALNKGGGSNDGYEAMAESQETLLKAIAQPSVAQPSMGAIPKQPWTATATNTASLGWPQAAQMQLLNQYAPMTTPAVSVPTYGAATPMVAPQHTVAPPFAPTYPFNASWNQWAQNTGGVPITTNSAVNPSNTQGSQPAPPIQPNNTTTHVNQLLQQNRAQRMQQLAANMAPNNYVQHNPNPTQQPSWPTSTPRGTQNNIPPTQGVQANNPNQAGTQYNTNTGVGAPPIPPRHPTQRQAGQDPMGNNTNASSGGMGPAGNNNTAHNNGIGPGHPGRTLTEREPPTGQQSNNAQHQGGGNNMQGFQREPVDAVGQIQQELAAMRQQLANLNVGNLGPNRQARIPTFTDLSNYPDPDPNDPRTRHTDMNSREYHLKEFRGGTDKDKAAGCKAFLQDAVRLGKDHRLSHQACKRLINRHTVDEPKEIVANEMRDDDVPLENVVRALELRFMGLVDPDKAKSQMYAITRKHKEDLNSLQRRLCDRAQMACRQIPGQEKLRAEHTMVKDRFLALLSPSIRNILREREKMRQAIGQEQYQLVELVEEAVVIETDQEEDGNVQGGQKTVSFPKNNLYHEQRYSRLPSPPPPQQREPEYRPPPAAHFTEYATPAPHYREYAEERDWVRTNQEEMEEQVLVPMALFTGPGRDFRGRRPPTFPVRRLRDDNNSLPVTPSADYKQGQDARPQENREAQRAEQAVSAPTIPRERRSEDGSRSTDWSRNSRSHTRETPDSERARDWRSNSRERDNTRDRREWGDRDRREWGNREQNRPYRDPSRERQRWNDDSRDRNRWASRNDSRERPDRRYNGSDRPRRDDRSFDRDSRNPGYRQNYDRNDREWSSNRNRPWDREQRDRNRGRSGERAPWERRASPENFRENRREFIPRRNSQDRDPPRDNYPVADQGTTGERARSQERVVKFQLTAKEANVEPGSCLRCGQSHDTWECPKYGRTALANGYCFRCKRGAHLAINCLEPDPPPRTDKVEKN